MREIELCMKYDTCNRCPLNQKCEEEYQKEMGQKSGDPDGEGSSDLQILRCGSARTPMPTQKEPSKER